MPPLWGFKTFGVSRGLYTCRTAGAKYINVALRLCVKLSFHSCGLALIRGGIPLFTFHAFYNTYCTAKASYNIGFKGKIRMEERYNLTLNVLRFTLLIVTLGLAIGCSGKDDSLRQSEMLIRSGMHPEAINLLEKIIAADDRNPKARFLLGQAYEGLGSYDQAIHNYRTAINLYAAHPEDRATVRFALAKVYLKQGLRERGYNELRTIVRSTSDSAVLQQVAGLVTDAYQVEQLTSGKKDNYSPRFSPDGSQLAFASYRLDNGEIFIMDLDGRVRQRVTFTTDFDEGEPAFLHDPRHLIYSREPQTSRQVKILLQSSGSTPIYAGFYTTHIHSKVTQEIMPVGFGVRSLGISPDRQRVAYESNSAGNLELYTLDLRGVDLGAIDPETIPSQQITHNEVDDGSPVFFPTGNGLRLSRQGPMTCKMVKRNGIRSIASTSTAAMKRT